EALKWFRLAAMQRDAFAQYNIGAMYVEGLGVPQDYSEALKWYRLAAKQGIAEAQTSIGVMYDEGLGVGQDYAEALKWYRQAAEQGDANAKNNTAWILATAKDSKLRNGALAIRLAQQAVADRADAARIDTLAAANPTGSDRPARSMRGDVVGRHFPVMAVVAVDGLIEDRALVEIEATAVVPFDGD
ncbi:MAG: hypothetical protein O6909_07155, partial [Alphaproteobacteria bacterium]|nr:hypothetical protein [Alphaproteobacteria bacterium]